MFLTADFYFLSAALYFWWIFRASRYLFWYLDRISSLVTLLSIDISHMISLYLSSGFSFLIAFLLSSQYIRYVFIGLFTRIVFISSFLIFELLALLVFVFNLFLVLAFFLLLPSVFVCIFSFSSILMFRTFLSMYILEVYHKLYFRWPRLPSDLIRPPSLARSMPRDRCSSISSDLLVILFDPRFSAKSGIGS